MAQNYSELRKDNVRDAIYEDVANNLEVLRTSWAGNAFPENPKVGQACYRIDEDNLYFWDGTTWSQKGGGGIDMNTGDKLYDWVGTLAEYKEQDIENQHPEYLCFITDDNVETKQVVTLPVGFIAQTVVPIDESLDLQKYANGQLIFADKFPELVNKLKKSPNLLVDEDTWQAEKNLSVFGQCGKFVLDEVAGTIRLPLIINSQGLTDLSVIGSIKNESLPNITGRTSAVGTLTGTGEAQGALYDADGVVSGVGAASGETWGGIRWYLDASRSSSAYKDGAPVQQEAILYPYFIQVANEVDERLPAIREYKLNNPHFFGESKWSDVEPNNASWLLSNGAYHSGKTYVDYYKWLTDIKSGNKTVEGVSVKGVSDVYDDYDFVINTADETFRLPLLNGSEDWVGSTSQTLSTADIVSGSPFVWTASQNGFIKFTCYSSTTQVVIAKINNQVINYVGAGVPTTVTPRPGFWLKVKKRDVVSLAAESGTLEHVAISFVPAVGNGSLYFYIGDVLQDPAVINAGAVLSEVDEVKRRQSVIDIPSTSGTVPLADNTIYKGTMVGAMTFALPTVTDATKYHQIKAMLYLPVVTIDWGTAHYIGGDAPDVSEAGQYMIYWDYVPALSAWAVGAIKVV